MDDYIKVFKQQEEEGIIERIEVDPQKYADYTWIPHRSIIKTEQQVTTKIRPVFNCSLKTHNSPSLIEAAYPGVNLMTDMTKLLLYFRSKFTMISDIRKAFLMIKLGHEEYKNRFCFFLKEGNKLSCFRYKTIIFGYNASPFISNFIIKQHAKQFPSDYCSEVLLNNFYVDNLMLTANDQDKLLSLYLDLDQRMKKGGFALRSWTSNNPMLRERMISDNKYIEHESPYEKLLGYKYSTKTDVFKLSGTVFDKDAKTKRGISCQTSKLFDPLGLYLPVTVRSKILMRELWSQNLSWDENVMEKHLWSQLAHDLTSLNVTFPRYVVNEAFDTDLYLFCDSSKQSYGFALYNVQDNKSNLMFAKAKVTPIKPRSLPTLELLSVFLGVKCMHLILDSYPNVTFKKLVIAVDAQVVLSWLMSQQLKTKNQFAKNRLKDISMMTQELKVKYNLDIVFKYVPTDQNPADLLTRGLSLNKFKDLLQFWTYGTEWLKTADSDWPVNELNCLTDANKKTIQTNVAIDNDQF